MANKYQFNVKPMSIRIALWAFLGIILLTALALFGLVDLTKFITDILLVASISFVLVEASIVAVIKKQKSPDIVSMLSIIVSLLALVAWVVGLFGKSITFLQPFQGLIVSVLFVLVLVEAIRK